LKNVQFFQSEPNNHAYITMTSQQRWYWTFDYFNNKISLLYSLCSCKIRSWTLHFHQFGVYQVNTAQSSTLLHSCLLNKWAKFCTKMFPHFWDIIIFELGYFLVHPADKKSPAINNPTVGAHVL